MGTKCKRGRSIKFEFTCLLTVDSVQQMLPDAVELLGILAAKKRRIENLNTTVVANLTLLRERIALARDESNRVSSVNIFPF